MQRKVKGQLTPKSGRCGLVPRRIAVRSCTGPVVVRPDDFKPRDGAIQLGTNGNTETKEQGINHT